MEEDPPARPAPRGSGGRRIRRDSRSLGTLKRLRRVRQNLTRARPGNPPVRSEYAFLLGRLIDADTLWRGEAAARRSGVATHEALIALGWVAERDYVGALADSLGLARGPPSIEGVPITVVGAGVVVAANGGAEMLLVDAVSRRPDEVLAAALSSGWPLERIALVSRSAHRQHEEASGRAARIDHAVNALRSACPDQSAAFGPAAWQLAACVGLIGLMAGAALVAEDGLAVFLSLAAAPLFACVVALRLVALFECLGARGWRRPLSAARRRDRDLPVYSVLVPLFREAEVLPDLVVALAALDYPAAKLDIMIVLESIDRETQAAARALDLPGRFRVVVVPEGGPRTKPKALNYALGLARGSHVVVYDAEDVPEPDQLRKAIAAFAGAGPRLACVQARLNIYNPRASWLTRQFTLEYSALFDALLPALVRLRLPLPLGGTSNHFPVEVLRRLGGWDPYNVTEDADLGIRIARAGLETRLLASTTWEEAPERAGVWLRQRTRWLKGWLQTYIVHTRRPLRLLADLGLARTLGFHAFMGGVALSALVHPLFYVLLGWQLASDGALFAAAGGTASWLLWIAAVNLVAGYAGTMSVSALAAVRRGRPGLAVHALLAPLFWLLISAAAYRALWQLFSDPHGWEKTPHGLARRREVPAPIGSGSTRPEAVRRRRIRRSGTNGARE